MGLFVKFMIGATGLAITFNFLWHSLLGLDLAGFFFSSFAMLILVVIVMFRALVLDAEVPATGVISECEKKRCADSARLEGMVEVVMFAEEDCLDGRDVVANTAWQGMIDLFRSPRDVDFMDDSRWERFAAASPVSVALVVQDRASRLRVEDDWTPFLLTLKTTGRSNLDDPRKV